MTEHSLNGPSSFARRIGCPGSANAERGIPDTASIYAAEGTAAHALGEKCLKEGRHPSDFAGHDILVREGKEELFFPPDRGKHSNTSIEDIDGQSFPVNEDMIEAVEIYTDYCFDLMNKADVHLIEEKLELPFIGEDQKGTGDFGAIVDGILHAVDYKHGKGKMVEVAENVQAIIYGLGMARKWHNYDWHTLRLTIVQPRAPHSDGPVRSWDISREDVIEYSLDYAEAAAKTEDKNAPLVPGEWCGFCKAKPTCPAHEKFAMEAAASQFDDTTAPTAPEDMDPAKLADLVLNKIPVIEDWCKSVKEYAQRQAEAGNPPPGTKLVPTRATRRFMDEAKVEKSLPKIYPSIDKEKFYTEPKLKSVAQIEKVVGKKNMEPLADQIESKSTGVTLVPDSDPRKPAKINGADQFGSVDFD